METLPFPSSDLEQLTFNDLPLPLEGGVALHLPPASVSAYRGVVI